MAGNHIRSGARWSWAWLLLLTGSLSYGQATVEGKVHLPTAPPPAPARQRYAGQAVQPGSPEPPTAVVYLVGAPSGGLTPPEPVVLAQTNLQFTASLLPVRAGTKVIFPNHDGVYHNVFSYSKPKRFDLGRYRTDETPPPQRFDHPGLVKLYCEIHPHMRSRILVLDTPYFVKTDFNGHFRLENLPAGRYELKAWVDEADVRTQAVTLPASGTVQVEFPDAQR